MEHDLHGTVKIALVSTSDVFKAVMACSQQHHSNVIMLGASRDRLLQQVMHGNIPEAIARNSGCTVILVRGAEQ